MRNSVLVLSTCVLWIVASFKLNIPKVIQQTLEIKSNSFKKDEPTNTFETFATVAKTTANYMPNRDSEKNMKLGVLFLNLGGPETIEDVEGFLYNLFADPDIIRLPPFVSFFQKPIAYAIAKRRSPKSSAAYKSIGGGSPIVKYTREQSDLVQAALQKRGLTDAKCYFAMRYWHPYTDEVLEQVQEDGINTLVVVPLYPQFSISTSGSSLRVLQDIFYQNPQKWGPEKVAHTVVPAWYHRPGYIKVMAKLVLERLNNYSTAEMAEGLHVLYSAHGVPESYIEAGDPYKKQIEECVQLISQEVNKQLLSDRTRPSNVSKRMAFRLAGVDTSSENIVGEAEKMFGNEIGGTEPPLEFHLSFQSRVGPVKWLSPYTEDKLEELGKEKGVKNLMVVPISFVSEHIETLEEIDMEYKELAEECGIVHWERVPALNTDPMFIEDMADLVLEALEAPTLTIAEAASSSYSDILATEGLNAGAVPSSAGSSSGAKVRLGLDRITASNIGETRMTAEDSQILRGQFAFFGLIGTSILEILNHPIVQSVGFK